MTPDNHNDSPGDLLRELENLQRVLDDAAGENVAHGRDIPVLDPMDDIPVLDDLFNTDDIPVLKAVPRSAKVTQLPVNRARPVTSAESASGSDNPHPVAEAIAAVQAARLAVEAAKESAAKEISAAKASAVQEAAAAVQTTPPATSAATNTNTVAADATASVTDASAQAADTSASSKPAAGKPASSNPFLPQAILDRLAQEREAAQHSAEEAHRTMQKVMEQKQARAQQTLAGMGKTLTQSQKDMLVDQLIAEMLPAITERLREKLKHLLNL
ncbi:hypothetical protein ACQUQU_08455 [Thalassolituus sp. LLYu03]|uniref:hypothetical protein n=1 Tax=Thalassolituus sp. LLYu03 TaxID=3421656 RepID=UPI003D2BCB88